MNGNPQVVLQQAAALPTKPYEWEVVIDNFNGEIDFWVFHAIFIHTEGKEPPASRFNMIQSNLKTRLDEGMVLSCLVSLCVQFKYRPTKITIHSGNIEKRENNNILNMGLHFIKIPWTYTTNLSEIAKKEMAKSRDYVVKQRPPVVQMQAAFSTAPGMTDEYLRELFTTAKTYYEQQPWFLLPSHHVFDIEVPEADGKTVKKVLQVLGYGGYDFGAAIWKSTKDLEPLLLGEAEKAFFEGDVSCFFFQGKEEMAPRDQAAVKRLKLPIAAGDNTYPNITAYVRPPPNLFTIQIIDLCFKHLNDLIREKLKPSDVYHYHPLTIKYDTPANSHNKIKWIRFSYPAKDLIPMEQRKLGNMPGYVPVVPKNKDRIGAGIEYYRQQVASTPQSSSKYYPLLYGLANALWKIEEVDSTKEALDLAMLILKHMPDDYMGVRYFALDLMFEIKEYDRALQLLHMYPEEWSATWFWSAALLTFLSKGPDNPASIRALKSALDQNPTVYDFLTGKERFTDGPMTYSIRFQAGKKPQGDKAEAQYYLKNFKRYWGHSNGALDWVVSKGPGLLAELDKETGEFNSKKNNVPAGGTMAELHLPKVKFCNVCKSIQNVKLCSRCKAVYYCSPVCQKADWSTHKVTCKKKEEA